MISRSPKDHLRGHGSDHLICSATHLNLCPWCRKKRPRPTHFAIYALPSFDKEARAYNLADPSIHEKDPGLLVYAVGHAQCVSHKGYVLDLGRFLDAPHEWLDQMASKPWWIDWMLEALFDVIVIHWSRIHPAYQALCAWRHDRLMAKLKEKETER